MVDYNFFEGYRVRKAKPTAGIRVFNVIFIVALLCLIAVVWSNYYRIDRLEVELAEVKGTAHELSQSAEIARILEKQALMDELDEVVASLEAAGEGIQYGSAIDEQLMAAIADAMPVDIRLDDLEIENRAVQISGTGDTKPAIAEMVYQLREMGIFSDLHITQITRSKDGETYEFGLSFKVGGDVSEDQ